ncbi:MAG: DUF559 domain-containing protein [Actinomycetota bacterium]|nr:DUF559 domain-containing protein [Actinomycetota bacterium]
MGVEGLGPSLRRPGDHGDADHHRPRRTGASRGGAGTSHRQRCPPEADVDPHAHPAHGRARQARPRRHPTAARTAARLGRRVGARAPLPTPRSPARVPEAADAVTFKVRTSRAIRVDFLYAAQQVVVEVSGRLGHASDADRGKDARRRNELQHRGFEVIEFTTADVMADPAYVIASLRRSLPGLVTSTPH